jgi:hypothetical protein
MFLARMDGRMDFQVALMFKRFAAHRTIDGLSRMNRVQMTFQLIAGATLGVAQMTVERCFWEEKERVFVLSST